MADSFRNDIRHPDYQGPNPFADDVVDAEGVDAKGAGAKGAGGSVYAAAEGYQNEEYAESVGDRGWTIIAIGSAGLFATVLGLIATGNAMCIPMPLFALGLSIPTWLMGRNDLAAMRAGAMSKQRRSLTLIGMILGFLGTVFSLIILIIGLWQFAVMFLGFGA